MCISKAASAKSQSLRHYVTWGHVAIGLVDRQPEENHPSQLGQGPFVERELCWKKQGGYQVFVPLSG